MVRKKGLSGCDAGPSKAKNNQYSFLIASVEQRQPRRRRDHNAEARRQAAIVEWARTVAPDVLIFAVPNGGLRSKAEAARLKWTGVLAGIPDLAVIAPCGRVFFLEVKTPVGRLSPDQRAVHDRLVALGTPPAVVRSIDDARLAFGAWGISTPGSGPLSATVTRTDVAGAEAAPAPEAVAEGRNLVFAYIEEIADLSASYSRSVAEAAFRGDQRTIETHLRQLRLCVLDLIGGFKLLDGDGGGR